MYLPNLICLGVEKSGTTSIYNILKKNVNIFSIRKETEFFTFLKKKKTKKYYINNLNEYQKLFSNYKKQKYILDVSTTYMPSDEASINIFNLCNDPKLIICLRNPITRAYSRYWMAAGKNYSLTNLSFQKFKSYFLNHGKKEKSKWNNIRYRGMYYEQIKRYLDKFNKKRILIIFYEDFNKKELLEKKLMKFLKIKIKYDEKIYAETLYSKNKFIHKILNFSFKFKLPDTFAMKFIKMIKRILRKKFLKKYPPMSNEIKNFLKNYYIHDIKKTEKLLKINLCNWYI